MPEERRIVGQGEAGAGPQPLPVGEDAAALLLPEVQEQIRREVSQAGAGEVLFYGRIDAEGRVAALTVAARGHRSAAPAVLSAASGWDVAIHNHPSGDLRPSQADLEVSAVLSERGLASYVVSNDARRVFVIVPHRPATPAPGPLAAEEVAAILGPEGPIAGVLGPGYEPREGQQEMADEVAQAFRADQIALLEAGTGTGKTFAYLVPAALAATRRRERVVISTATIHLQEQLALKDVPLLRAALRRHQADAPPLEAVVVKGRGNYVSLRRAEEAAALEADAFGSEAEREEVARLVAWARETSSGDRGELTPPPSPDGWEHVESTSDNCLAARCPRFGDCHYYAARRRASRAGLVIANHSLLLSDLAIKRETGFDEAAVLPPFRRVILDEAHHLEQTAGEHFGVHVSNAALARPLGRLQRRGGRGRGLLPTLQRDLSRAGRVAEPLARRLEEELLPARARAAAELERTFTEVGGRLHDELPPGEQQLREARLRLRADHGATLAPLGELGKTLALLVGDLERLAEDVRRVLSEREAERLEPVLREVEAAARRLGRGAQGLEAVLTPDPRQVRWAELHVDPRGGPRLALRASPLQVGEALREALFRPVQTAVLCSATLSVRGEFTFLEEQLGLDQLPAERLRRARIPSPFDYERQALLAVPRDLPLPDQPGYEEALAAACLEAVRCSRGRAFLLFTSYGALGRAFARLAEALREEGLTPLRQGEASRQELLDRFRRTPGAVLFGTDSFWEGVDVPGDRLVLVVIARLPFRVPSDPLQEARAEAVAAAGGDPFHALQLPQAVLKLTQGFGRLIRTRDDRGAVVVLDGRLLRRGYGRAFFESLPPVRVEAVERDELAATIAPFVRP